MSILAAKGTTRRKSFDGRKINKRTLLMTNREKTLQQGLLNQITHLFDQRKFYSGVFITLEFETKDPSSNQGGTFFSTPLIR